MFGTALWRPAFGFARRAVAPRPAGAPLCQRWPAAPAGLLQWHGLHCSAAVQWNKLPAAERTESGRPRRKPSFPKHKAYSVRKRRPKRKMTAAEAKIKIRNQVEFYFSDYMAPCVPHRPRAFRPIPRAFRSSGGASTGTRNGWPPPLPPTDKAGCRCPSAHSSAPTPPCKIHKVYVWRAVQQDHTSPTPAPRASLGCAPRAAHTQRASQWTPRMGPDQMDIVHGRYQMDIG
jgi:hypothetical protein